APAPIISDQSRISLKARKEHRDLTPNYKPPAQKSLQEIQELDKDDESLHKHKKAFLGKKGVKVDKSDCMVGSCESHKGMLARAIYNIKSKFTDYDKHDQLSWEWSFTVKKD
uniref:Rho GDP-dissociation inhibitor 1 n=1 Tax=Stegastes partitus TaxID=144197 RepID=A0A3B4ZB04_9TELE